MMKYSYRNTLNTPPKHQGVKLLTGAVPHRTENTVSPFGDTKIYGTPSLSVTQSPISDTKTGIDELLQKNPTLKQRIQGMTWYRDYISGRLDKHVAEQYIFDAFSIESIFEKNPGLLHKIQYENWWQRYTRGDINPTDMLYGNIAAYLQLQQIEKEKPELYAMASKSPLWKSGIQQGEDYIVVGQREILTSLSLGLKFLDEHPEIEKKLQEQGFTRNNLATDDWSKGEGVYKALDIIREEQGI